MDSWTEVAYSAGLVVVAALILLLARATYGWLSRFDVDRELTGADNPAVGVSLFGYMAGVVVAFAGIMSTEAHVTEEPGGLLWDVFETTLYGIFCVLLVKLSGWFNDRLVLHTCENRKELVEDRNVGAAAVLCGSYLASGMVLAGAFSGRIDTELIAELSSPWERLGFELLIAISFYALAQVVLALYAYLYARLTKHDPLAAIADNYELDGVWHGGNMAAGIALGGHFIAMGVILWGGVRGDFTSWSEHLQQFGLVVGVGLVVLPLWCFFADRLLLGRGANMAREIYEDRNPNAALLELVVLVGLAAVLALVLGPEAG